MADRRIFTCAGCGQNVEAGVVKTHICKKPIPMDLKWGDLFVLNINDAQYTGFLAHENCDGAKRSCGVILTEAGYWQRIYGTSVSVHESTPPCEVLHLWLSLTGYTFYKMSD